MIVDINTNLSTTPQTTILTVIREIEEDRLYGTTHPLAKMLQLPTKYGKFGEKTQQ